MSEKSKVLSASLAAVYSTYHDARRGLLASARETIRDDLAAVKKAIGVAGLKVTFYDDHDGPGASLDVQDKAESNWENWDEDSIGHRRGLLENLQETLEELAPYLEWNGTEIIA